MMNVVVRVDLNLQLCSVIAARPEPPSGARATLPLQGDSRNGCAHLDWFRMNCARSTAELQLRQMLMFTDSL